MKRVYLLPIFFILCLVLFKLPIFAENERIDITPLQGGMPLMMKMNPEMMPGRGFPPPPLLDPSELLAMLDEIGINKQTAEKIATISRNYLRVFDERIIHVQREELDIKEELLKDKPDLQSIQTMINKKTQVFSEIEFGQIKRDLEIKSLLTDQEYEKWKAVMLERIHKRTSRFHEKMNGHQFEPKR